MFRRNAVFGCSALIIVALLGSVTVPRKSVLSVEAATTPIATSQEPTDRPAERYQGSFFDLTTAAMLTQLGVVAYKEDKVYAFPNPSLGLGSEIRVYRAQPVLVRDGTSEHLVRTWRLPFKVWPMSRELRLVTKTLSNRHRRRPLPYKIKRLSSLLLE